MKNKKTLIEELSEQYGIKITIDKRLNSVTVKNRNPESLAKANKIIAQLNLETLIDVGK